MKLRRLAAVPVLLFVVAACGDQADEPAAGGTPSASDASGAASSDMPACDAVWVDGATLPGSYSGCMDGASEVPSEQRPCEFGKPLVTFADHFYAVPGERVNEVAGSLSADKAYRSALASCTG